MKKIIVRSIVGVSILLAFIYFNHNVGDLHNIIDFESVDNYSSIEIIESWQGESNSIMFSNTDLKEIYGKLSKMKYFKVRNSKDTYNEMFYQFLINNGTDYFSFIIDNNGFRSMDKKSITYFLKNEELEELISVIQSTVDDNEAIENYVSVEDYIYIKNNLANEISFFKILEKIDIDVDEIILERFNLSISSNGYIESFNLSFYKEYSDDKYMVKYRKKEELFKTVVLKNAKLKEYELTESTKIIESIDNLLTELEKQNGNRYLRLIELYSLYETTHIQKDNIYVNGELATEEKLSGITFTLYDTYSSEDKGISLYIFEIND